MNDEKYVFFQEIRDKKITARSSQSKRTHAGKGGSIKFPSDFMTKKELQAMNSETKTYRMNKPMAWKEYKAMADDIKIKYVKQLQEKYNVPLKYIGEMFGVSKMTMSNEAVRLGLNCGHGRPKRTWDKAGWDEFCNQTAKRSALIAQTETPESVLPCSGSMTFIGTVESALKTAKRILGETTVKISISFEQCKGTGVDG